MNSKWEYRTAEDWRTLLNEWLSTHQLTDKDKRSVEAYKQYLDRLDNPFITSRWKYETNGMLNSILHRLNANE